MTGRRRSSHGTSSSSTSTSAYSNSTNNASIVSKLNMLRSFVPAASSSPSAFTETDLSTCLRQSNYNVELAAERLMTGQFPSSRKRQKQQHAHTPSPKNGTHNHEAATSTSNVRHTPTASTSKSRMVTPKTPSQGRTAIHPRRKSPSSTCTASVTSESNQSTSSARKNISSNNETENSWLLCPRWISDGVCLQRNGCMTYQETLQVELVAPPSSSSENATVAVAVAVAVAATTTTSATVNSSLIKKKIPAVRFRGRHILGCFPKHLHPLLGPLLEAKLIQVKVQALIEERNLPTGAEVALSISVFLPDPTKFFDILHPESMDAPPANLFNNKNIGTMMKKRISFSSKHHHHQQQQQHALGVLAKAAFGLLQWAQNGEVFTFSRDDENNSSNSRMNEIDTHDGRVVVVDDTKNNNTNDMVLVEDGETENPMEHESSNNQKWGIQDSINANLPGIDAPSGFRATLRPYQRQALWWMTQREAQEELEESSRQQLQLLEELVEESSSAKIAPSTFHSTANTAIHCECGPVMVDTTRIEAPSIIESHKQADQKHPLWERRFLCNSSKTKACSFYVQPLFGVATAYPPPPPKPCRGGILADSMGLGKTIMVLALVQSSIQSNDKRPTLIVSPLSLLFQWQEEIESKTNMTYHVFYGDKKQCDSFTTDVVLTTYGTLQSEWIAFSKNPESHCFLSHDWKRVILDEAHHVKNPSTVASKACCMLRTERRWCLSGTIIQNSLDDVFALIKFLGHEPWCQPSFWKSSISSLLHTADGEAIVKQTALDRVRRLLASIMLRRTKESMDQDGNLILSLPPVETKLISVELSAAERQFYDALHRKSLSLFEGFIQAGTASKSWLAIFSLLHRLRQTCDHVALTVKSHIAEDQWTNQISFSKDEPKTDSIDKVFLDDLMCKFRSMQSPGRKSSTENNECASYAEKVANMLNQADKNKSLALKEECAICLDPIALHDAVVTPCFHMFCKDCLIDVLRREKDWKYNSTHQNTIIRLPNGPCPVCTENVDASKILRLSQVDGNIQASYLLSSIMSPAAIQTRENDSAARKALETAVKGSTSTKLSAILQELDNVWEEEPGSKILIFSQFLGFLDLLGESFRSNQIPFFRLDGKLSLKDRMTVLKQFGSPDKENDEDEIEEGANARNGSVLLISMKAGGVGLNLVAANTVFIADPWWNAAVEDQCVDRIHRIGQTASKVRVRKFYVSDSVEERIVELQTRKKNVANKVLCDKEGENEANQPTSPTLEDFKILFRT